MSALATLEKELEDIAREMTGVVRSIKKIKAGPQCRKVLEKIQSYKEKLAGLVGIQARLRKAFDVASLKKERVELEAQLEGCKKEIRKTQATLDDIVEHASDVEKEVWGKYTLRGLKKTAALVVTIEGLNENCKYYLEEIRRVNVRIQKLSE